MRYRLRTLLIVLALGPVVFGATWWTFDPRLNLDDANPLVKTLIALTMFGVAVLPMAYFTCRIAGIVAKKR